MSSLLRSGILALLAGLCAAQTAPVQSVINTIAGNGVQGFAGDGNAATSAELSAPEGLAIDSAGNLYFADVLNYRIRKVTPAGVISTVAGSGAQGSSGDGGPATSAAMAPFSVAVDAAGNLYIADAAGPSIRKVTSNGTISTVAGNGKGGFSGDGGPATSAELFAPEGVALDSAGNIYIADTDNHRIRKVTTAGIISTVAGNGTAGFSGDGGPATGAALHDPTRIAVDAAGNIYIADEQNNRIRKVTTAGIITTVAGNGTPGYSGDGGVATNAMIYNPYDVAVDTAGNVYFTDSHNNRIRKIDPNDTITTIAGTATGGFSGDGGPAVSAELTAPSGILLDATGSIYVGDTGNNRIRKIGSAAPFVVAPSTLSFGTYLIGAVVPPAQTISLSSTAPGLSFTSSLGSDCAWLTLSSTSGSTPATLNATVNSASLTAPGSHSCAITFNSPGVSPSPTVTATLTAASSTLSAAPATLSFGTYLIGGTVPATQTISLTSANPTSGLLFGSSLGSDCAWLTLSPASGSTPASISASVNPSGVVAGAHSCVITFSAAGVSPSPTVTATLTAASSTLSAAPATLSFGTYVIGGTAPAAQTISLTSANPASGLLFGSSLGSDCAWLTLSPASGSTPASIATSVNTSGVVAGAHSCVITFSAAGVSPSPTVTATLTATTPTTLSVAPATLSFGTYTIGAAAPAAQTIAVSSASPASGVAFTSSLGSDCAWLNLSPASGSTPATLSASVNAAGVVAGSHSCVITFNASGVSPSPTVTATLTANAPPTLSAAPATLSFGSYTIGSAAPAAQTIAVSSTNPASGLAFTSALGSDCAWLTLTPSTGSTPATVSASVNTAGVVAGTHSCVITINAPGVSTGTVVVTATLTATAPPSTLSAAPATLTFGNYALGAVAPAAQTIAVSSTNPATGLGFTSALGSDCAWLTLTPSSGSTPTTISASINTATATLGSHSCAITINAAGVSSAPVTATLTVVPPTAPTLQIVPSITQVSSIATGAGLTVNLSSAAPANLTATLALSFAPNAAGLPATYTDPGLQFAQGGLTTTLTINQGSTSASLPASNSIQVGSVAGTVSVAITSLTETVNGQLVSFVLPTPNPSTTIVIPRLAPVITSVKIINVTTTGFTVDVVASSTPRDLSNASVTFTPASGDQLNGTSYPTIALAPATAWFSSTPGQTAGGAFDLQIPFTYSGSTGALGSVSVTLANSVSTSSAVSGTM